MGEISHLRLHYSAPASRWEEGLPVGNGRLGAVVHGQPGIEVLQLNEDSVWSGGPQDRAPPDARQQLPELRRLIRADKHAEAEALVKLAFFANPRSQRHYEPLARATFEFGHKEFSNYRRSLDLETAQALVEYEHDGAWYRRDLIASYPDNVLLWRFTASKKTRFIARLDRMSDSPGETNTYADTIKSEGNRIVLHASSRGDGGPRLCSVLAAVCGDTDGSIEAIGSCLVINSASCLVAIGAHTTFRHADPKSIATTEVVRALASPWNEIVERHQQDYCRLFNRMSLRMWPDASDAPTDIRLQSRESRDPGLVALYHNYGRYLLISSSRDGHKALPATLQGIWNPSFTPPWGSKYTININLQMNYWPAAPCSLVDDCALPVVNLLERMSIRGAKTADAMYGCRGWCAHHNTDIWADTNPQDHWMPATVWPLGGVWVSVTMMDMLRYQYDEVLHRRIFVCHEGAVQFLLDFLVPSSDGSYLVTNPSLSPENTFHSTTGEVGVFCEGSTMDMTLIRVAFLQFLWSVDRLGDQKDHPLKAAIQTALSKIPPILVNDEGRIQEWGLNNYEEDEPGHRHVSHLLGLYPADLISPSKSPELVEAAKAVLKRRLAFGGGHTGWSRAWLLNFYARLLDGEACGENMDLLLSKSTLPNLLDTHPPFQIDGNFGACAGILECLVQSMEVQKDGMEVVEIRLLPACPQGWVRGNLERVRTKQGWLVSFGWGNEEIIGPVTLIRPDTRVPNVHLLYPDGHRIVDEDEQAGEHIICRK